MFKTETVDQNILSVDILLICRVRYLFILIGLVTRLSLRRIGPLMSSFFCSILIYRDVASTERFSFFLFFSTPYNA